MILLPLLFATIPALGPSTPASDTYLRQAEVVEAMNAAFPQVKVTTVWRPCGELNGLYHPRTHILELCTEGEQNPDVATFIAAHEMSHAILIQIADDGSEQDADELAAIALCQLGEQRAVLGTALWFEEAGGDHIPGDEHPGNRYRAWELMAIEDGSEQHPADKRNKALYDGLLIRYGHRLSTP